MVQFDEDKQNRKLEEISHREQEDLAKILSRKYQIPYIDLSGISIDTDALSLVEEPEARSAKVAGFDLVGKQVRLATKNPSTEAVDKVVEDLAKRGYQVKQFLVSESSLKKAWSRYKDITFARETEAGMLEISSKNISEFIEKGRTKEEVKELIEETIHLKQGQRITRIVEIIVASAISLDASDVHVEPENEYVTLRMRLDGILVPILTFDRETYKLLRSRVKLLSGLLLNVEDKAQDGRFSITIDDKQVEVRTSMVPGAYGESIVMRILDPDSISVPLEDLGMPQSLLEVMRREIGRPNGMILNTGPTGSGKTTTLYAFLKNVHKPGIKILTIEDPIEYHLPGVTQTQTDNREGYSFATGLRASLRQDPDIIMVGEIRDTETAKTAVHAALTGHLVFSTLHTNNAAGAFPRLLDLGVERAVLGSALNVVMAQRLVRRLLPEHRKQVPIPEKLKVIIKRELSTFPQRDIENLKNQDYIWEADTDGLESPTEAYSDRIGLFEAIVVTEKIENLLKEGANQNEIEKVAKAQGLTTLTQDGLIKALSGTTSLSELERVIDIYED